MLTWLCQSMLSLVTTSGLRAPIAARHLVTVACLATWALEPERNPLQSRKIIYVKRLKHINFGRYRRCQVNSVIWFETMLASQLSSAFGDGSGQIVN
jgi:hypothetical protein